MVRHKLDSLDAFARKNLLLRVFSAVMADVIVEDVGIAVQAEAYRDWPLAITTGGIVWGPSPLAGKPTH